MARKLLREHIRSLFHKTKSSPYWEQLKKLPSLVRFAIGVLLILFWLLGMLTPIPAGVIFFVIGLALCIGLRRARAWTIMFVHFTRLHLLYSKAYMWYQLYKKKNSPR